MYGHGGGQSFISFQAEEAPTTAAMVNLMSMRNEIALKYLNC